MKNWIVLRHFSHFRRFQYSLEYVMMYLMKINEREELHMKDFARKETLIRKKFMEFFFPSVLMSMSTSLSIIVDSIIVGNVLGNEELAATNLIMPLSLCFTAVTAIFGIGASIYISVLKGQLDDKGADKCLTLSCIAWIGCSVFTVCLGIFATDMIAAFLAGSSGLKELVADYLKVYLIGSPFTFVTMIFPHIIRSDGKPKLASNVLIIANVTNLCLDVVFMKFVGMGLEGAALASICGYAFGSFLYLIYVFSSGRTLHMAKIKLSDFKLYIDMIKFSISSIMGQGFMFAKIWIFNMLIASVAGQEGLTAFSVCTSCLSFVSMFIAGAAQTMMPMVGAFLGSRDYAAIGMTVRKAIQVVIGCGVVITILFEAFPSTVLMLFGVTEGTALELGIIAVRLFSLSLVGIGISFLFMYYVQASKMPAFSIQICALEGFIVVVPVALIMAKNFGINGFWLAYTINEIIVITFIVIKAKYIVRRSNGKLYSIFMLQKPQENMQEASVDVSNTEAVEQGVKMLGSMITNTDFNTESICVEKMIRDILTLSRQAYEEKNEKKSNRIVDVIVEKDRITLKDMGKSYESINKKEVDLPKVVDKITCEYTLMIGMNYLEIRCKEAA